MTLTRSLCVAACAAALWLIAPAAYAQGLPDTGDAVGDATGGATDAVGDATGGATDAAGDATDTVEDTASGVTDTVTVYEPDWA